MKRLFILFNLGQQHWTLGVIHVQDKIIQYYDSIEKDPNYRVHADTKCKGVLNYLKDEHEKQYKGRKMNTSDWTIEPFPKGVPQQHNGE